MTFKQNEKHCEMKIFVQLKKTFATMGIDSRSSTQRIPLNARNFTGLFLMGAPMIMECVYLNSVVSEFREYVEFIKIIFAIWTGTSAYAAIVWKIPKLFRFFKGLEVAINRSM